MDIVCLELWVAAQRAMPSWARGRVNATVIMISQGAMAFGGLVWSSAAAVAGPIHALLGATVLFLVSLLLAGRLSINVRADPEQKVSGFPSGSVESGEGTPIALASHVYLLSMAPLVGSQGPPSMGTFSRRAKEKSLT